MRSSSIFYRIAGRLQGRSLLLTILIISFPGGFWSCGTPGKESAGNLYEGTIQVYGSEPHTWPGLETEDGRVYRLKGESLEVSRSIWQGQRVRLHGKMEREPAPLVPGILSVESIEGLDSEVP